MPLDPTKTSKTLDVAKTVILTGDADVGEVLSPKTFYKDDPETKLTGTMATVAIVAANDNYPAGYHAGNVGGLDAIDADLAPANIKQGITIFGKLGTYTATLTYDTEDDQSTAQVQYNREVLLKQLINQTANVESELITITINPTQTTVVHGMSQGGRACPDGASVYLRLYVDGVLQEQSIVYTSNNIRPFRLIGHKSCASGARIVKLMAVAVNANWDVEVVAGVGACADKVV